MYAFSGDLCYPVCVRIAWCLSHITRRRIVMAESKVYKVELSSVEFQLVQNALSMLKTSRTRAIAAEVDPEIREARMNSANVIAGLQVKLSNVK